MHHAHTVIHTCNACRSLPAENFGIHRMEDSARESASLGTSHIHVRRLAMWHLLNMYKCVQVRCTSSSTSAAKRSFTVSHLSQLLAFDKQVTSIDYCIIYLAFLNCVYYIQRFCTDITHVRHVAWWRYMITYTMTVSRRAGRGVNGGCWAPALRIAGKHTKQMHDTCRQ